ncbi:hypothetical protein NLX86_09245 [Streptomyces sp. A3M-1-3]|uniref:cupredoxin domain-containing protein n=1 Tax=Streptomyces sp. A3M-1-3 TaxID=2962044 RepID=UPI0020B8FE35|nr:hypothetical protein [Streptomyces sp. A3M-1-3]MCP3818292.1 hypothetical protein [Streptomyces sp. A3M-1-3]
MGLRDDGLRDPLGSRRPSSCSRRFPWVTGRSWRPVAVPLVIAHGGHLAYGVPLGLLVADAERTAHQLREVSPHTTAYVVLALVVALVLWQRPFATPTSVRAGEQVAPGLSAIVLDGRFAPQWLRVTPGGCVSLRNDDTVPYTLSGTGAAAALRLEPDRTTQVCFDRPGVLRVRTSDVPYTGGFVIVDRAEG